VHAYTEVTSSTNSQPMCRRKFIPNARATATQQTFYVWTNLRKRLETACVGIIRNMCYDRCGAANSIWHPNYIKVPLICWSEHFKVSSIKGAIPVSSLVLSFQIPSPYLLFINIAKLCHVKEIGWLEHGCGVLSFFPLLGLLQVTSHLASWRK